MYYFRYVLKNKHDKNFMFIQEMLKNKTLLCISLSTCPTVHVNKHLLSLTDGRVPTRGSNYDGTRHLRIRKHRIILLWNTKNLCDPQNAFTKFHFVFMSIIWYPLMEPRKSITALNNDLLTIPRQKAPKSNCR